MALKKDVADAKASAASVPAVSPASPPAGRVEAGDLSALQRNVADLTVVTDEVKSDLLAATTRADETKLALQKEVARLNDKAVEQGQAIQEMRGKLGRVEEIDRRMTALEEKVGKLGSAAPSPLAAPAPAAQDWKSPEEMYDYALGLIKGGEPRKGREILAAFGGKYPDHRLLPNVHYWKGESFYAEKDFENAILSFQDVIDKYPAGDKAPDAMYKQGLSFLSLNDRKNARIVLELLQSKYPKSPAAEKARQKLPELK
ncbi:MAG: tol-pal system protein YbgF [Deltaproteobacteria bacterium]|nr:tol-pal system protein YbgF [Deltaproteobacteria bacterium]